MKNLSWMKMTRCDGKIFGGALLAVAFGAAWLGWVEEARAQFPAPTRVAAKIDDVLVTMPKTPEFQANTSESKKDPKRREWLELEVKFKTESDSKVGLIPELMVSYFIAVQGTAPQVLTGSFTYANILDGEDNYAVIYVSPQGLARIAGQPNRFRQGDVKAVGVEILYQGRVVAEKGIPKDGWWTSTTAPRVSDLMLPKEKTPFSMLWIDRHIELKAE